MLTKILSHTIAAKATQADDLALTFEPTAQGKHRDESPFNDVLASFLGSALPSKTHLVNSRGGFDTGNGADTRHPKLADESPKVFSQSASRISKRPGLLEKESDLRSTEFTEGDAPSEQTTDLELEEKLPNMGTVWRVSKQPLRTGTFLPGTFRTAAIQTIQEIVSDWFGLSKAMTGSDRSALKTPEKLREAGKIAPVTPSHSPVLKMEVDSLGQISVQPKTVNGKVFLAINVDSEFAKNWLQQQLRDIGLPTDSLKIKVTSDNGLKAPDSAHVSDALQTVSSKQAVAHIRSIYHASQSSAESASRANLHRDLRSENHPGISARENLSAEFGGNPEKQPVKSSQEIGLSKGVVSSQGDREDIGSHKTSTLDGPQKSRKERAVPLSQSGESNSGKTSLQNKPQPSTSKGVDLEQDTTDFEISEHDLEASERKSLSGVTSSTKGHLDKSLPEGGALSGSHTSLSLINGKLQATEMIERSHFPEMIQKIAEIAKEQTSFKTHKLEVQLEVEKLGNLLVDAVKHRDKINLQINVESHEIRRLIETQIRPLLDQLIRDGIDIGKLEVSIRDPKNQGHDDHQLERDSSQTRHRHPRQQHPDRDLYSRDSKPGIERDFGYNSLEVWA